MTHNFQEEYETSRSFANSFLADCRNWRDYYNGRHWEHISGVDEHSFKPEINFIKTNVMQLLAMLQLKNPSILINPTKEAGTPTANMLTRALKTLYENKNVWRDVLMATNDMLVYTRGYQGIAWDPTMDGGKGNISSYVVSPFNIYIEPLARTVDEASYVHVTNLRSPFYIYTKYGIEMQSDDKDEFTNAEGIRVVESWYAPDATIPNGRHIIWAYSNPNKPFVDEENPYPFKEIPIVDYTLDFNSIGDRKSMVGDMWGDQKAIMKTIGLLLDNLMLTQNCQWVTNDPEAPEQLDNTPGLVHKTGTGLTPVVTPQLSPQWQNVIMLLQGMLPDISGIRQVNYGATQGGVTAASAIVALQEAGKTIKELREDGVTWGVERWVKMAVKMMRLYTSEHWMEMVGAVPNPKDMDTDYDISVSYSEALPTDKGTRTNISKVLTDSGIIDPIGFAEILGDPVLSKVVNDSQKRLAERQSAQMQAQAGMAQATGNTNGGNLVPEGS
jgi:hypothetical protein